MFGCYYKNELENGMPNMTLENIAKACEGTYVGESADLQKVIAGAVTDSRKVEKDYLFIPIRGERVDGHCFIPDVFEKGALAVLSTMRSDFRSRFSISVRNIRLRYWRWESRILVRCTACLQCRSRISA